MRKAFDAVATVGKYKDNQGNEKKRYVTIGAVFEDEQGRMSLKLDAVPCSPDWSGWVSFYETKQQGDTERRKMHGGEQRQDAHNQSKANGYQPQDGDDDDIPF